MTLAMWFQWIGATTAAAVTGTFLLMSHIDSKTEVLVPQAQFQDHKEEAREVFRDLRKQTENNSRKLDRVIELIMESRGG